MRSHARLTHGTHSDIRIARPFLAANYSQILAGALQGTPVDYVKIPTIGSAEQDYPEAADLGLPILLHNAHVNVPVAEPDLLASLDMEHFRHVIDLTNTPHVSVHLDALRPPDEPADLIASAIENLRWILSEVDLPLLVETPCIWAARAHTLALAIPDNIRHILDETETGLLLDVSHVRCSAHFLGWREDDYLASLPLDRTHEIHLTGSRLFPGRGRIDVHAPLDERDYDLLDRLLETTPTRFVTLEYGGKTAGSAVEVCRRHGLARNDPDALREQLRRIAALIES